jgi:hypothetical protein
VAGQEGPRLVIFFRIQTTVSVYPEHVELTCSGTFSRSEAFRVGERAFREAASAGRRSVLMDVRGVTGRVPSIFDRFDIGVHIAEQNFGRQSPQVAACCLGGVVRDSKIAGGTR